MQNIFNPYGNTVFPMAFQPFNQPQNPQQNMQQTPGATLIKVSGMEGAKAFQMPPNAAVALFHESEDIMYVKTTDGAGFPTIHTFRFEPYEEDSVKVEQYVTLDEFNRFKEEILNGKQFVRKSTKGSATQTTEE